MPWKNGLGTTDEIAIVPETAVFPDDPFLWRLSSATVQSAGPFSKFDRYDRWLLILEGEGVSLNGSILNPRTPRHFSGEIPIACELLGAEVRDLGLIYRRDKVVAKMSFETLSSPRTMFFDRGTHLFYGVEGTLTANDMAITPGETLWLEGPFEIHLSTPQRAQYVYIKLTK